MKNFSCTYSLFKVNHSMKSQRIEYGVNLLHKYKLEQAEVISRLLSSLLYHELQERFVRYIFLIQFHTSFSYDITSLGNIYPITVRKYTKHPKFPIKAFYKAFEKLL